MTKEEKKVQKQWEKELKEWMKKTLPIYKNPKQKTNKI